MYFVKNKKYKKKKKKKKKKEEEEEEEEEKKCGIKPPQVFGVHPPPHNHMGMAGQPPSVFRSGSTTNKSY